MVHASQRNLTSGDVTADRRADYAMMLAESGDHAAAVELMEQALELAPLWAAGWYGLGNYAEDSGDTAKAIAAWRKVVALEPDDVFGAGLKLGIFGKAPPPALPPSAFIEGLFDDYADRFDSALVEKLRYTAPEKLAALIAEETGDRTFRHAVDLGCGTGLLAAALGGRASNIEGYDLSERMLARSTAKGLYARLGKADLSLAPDESGLFGELARHRADLVAATDVMIYLGDLDAVFANAAALLAPGGIFAFSVEKAGDAHGFVLRPSLRYAHSARYVADMLGRHGIAVFAMSETTIRREADVEIIGLLFLARPVR